MDTFFVFYLVAMILLTLAMLARLFIDEGLYNRFIGILVMCTNVILILVLIGFVDGRTDRYSYFLCGAGIHNLRNCRENIGRKRG